MITDNNIHPSHDMNKERTTLCAPNGGTNRFYGIRDCKVCGAQRAFHPAGHFMFEALKVECGKEWLIED